MCQYDMCRYCLCIRILKMGLCVVMIATHDIVMIEKQTSVFALVCIRWAAFFCCCRSCYYYFVYFWFFFFGLTAGAIVSGSFVFDF